MVAYSAARALWNNPCTSRSLRPSTKSPRHTDPSPPPAPISLGGLPVGSVEIVNRSDLGQPVIETRHLSGSHPTRQRLRVARDGRVLCGAGFVEQPLHVPVAQAVHKIPATHGPLTTARLDLLQ